MIWERYNLFSVNMLRQCAVIGGGLGVLAGCQSRSEPDVVTTSPAVSKVQSSEEIASFSTPPSNIPLLAPGFDVPAATATVTESVPDLIDPKTEVAGQLFAQLVNPGLSPEEWDQTHSKLLEIGEKAVPVLAKGLQSSNNIEREMAATTLALLGPSAAGASSELMQALSDISPFVKANAAAALVLIPGQEAAAIPVLVETLNSPDPQLRQMAAMNLNVVGTEASPHVAELTRVLINERAPEVLVPVVQLLGRIGPGAAQAVPKLQQIAFDQPGEIGTEATNAINQIQTEVE